MDKVFSIAQFVLASLAFLCIVAGVLAHIVLGHITSILSFIVCGLFIGLTWAMWRVSYKELRDDSQGK